MIVNDRNDTNKGRKTMIEDIQSLDLDEIRIELEKLKAEKQSLAAYEARLKAEVIDRYAGPLREALAEKDEPFGTVNIGPVKFTVAKTVKWDQDGLKAIHDDIVSNGADPAEYMTVKYVVKEAAFKNWPDAIQNAFISARTVEQGSIAIEIKDGVD